MAISDAVPMVELLGAQDGGDDDVAAGAHAAVGADHDMAAQVVQAEHLMGLGQADLPRQAGVLDRGLGRGARAAVVAGDQDGVSLGLGHARGDGADARGGHQFHRDAAVGIDRLQVIDELGQVLDRIDVVVRRRADQGGARNGVTHLADELGDLEAGQLATLAGLGALGDLDLDLAALVQVFGGDAEPARSDLLDRRVHVVAVRTGGVTLRILAALARDRAGADAVHGHVQHAVRLRAQRAQGHAGGQEALPDIRDGFHLIDRDCGQTLAPVQQIARRIVGLGPDGVGILLEALVVAAVAGVLQQVDRLGVVGVGFLACPDAEEAADGRRGDGLGPGRRMATQGLGLQTGQADAGNPRRSAGEELGRQGAAEAQDLELATAAIGGDDRDALARQGLHQTGFQTGLVVQAGVAQRHARIGAAIQAVLEHLLGQPGVHGGGADADQDGDAMGFQRLGRADDDRHKAAQADIGQAQMDAGGGQDHRDRQAAFGGAFVGQDDQGAAALDRRLGLVGDPVERGAKAGAGSVALFRQGI